MYSIAKQILFRSDPETVHERVLDWLCFLQSFSVGRHILSFMAGSTVRSPVNAMGLEFNHPIGLAAGFDKNARAVPAIQALGFSFIEVGTVTPRPQPGNDKPRIWRFPESRALVNALGFPGEGAAAVAQRLDGLRTRDLVRIPIGVNVGKNADTPAEKTGDDCFRVIARFKDLADYFVINVSSPNTPGLRDLQTAARLRSVIEPSKNHLARTGNRPLLIKIAPDLADDDIHAIAALLKELDLAGIVAANTTIRRELVAAAASLPRGGLSGSPLYPRTIELVKLLRNDLPNRHAIIAVGGISTPTHVSELLGTGASLIQVYTQFVYGGPRTVRQMQQAPD